MKILIEEKNSFSNMKNEIGKKKYPWKLKPNTHNVLNTKEAKRLASGTAFIVKPYKHTKWISNFVNQYPLNFIQMIFSYYSLQSYQHMKIAWSKCKAHQQYIPNIFTSDIINSIVTRNHFNLRMTATSKVIPSSKLIKLFSPVDDDNDKDTNINNNSDNSNNDNNNPPTTPNIKRILNLSLFPTTKDEVPPDNYEPNLLKTVIPKSLDFKLVDCMEEFKFNLFQLFAKGMLRNVTWGSTGTDDYFRVVIGGGAIIAGLQSLNGFKEFIYIEQAIKSLPIKAKHLIRQYLKDDNSYNYFDRKNNLYNSTEWQTSDINIHLVCKDETIMPERISILIGEITQSIPLPFKVLKSEHSITILPLYPYRPIQIHTTLLRSITDHMLYCDIDSTSFLYDVLEDNVFTLEKGVNSLVNRVNLIHPLDFQNDYHIALKYSQRGFGAICFEFCKHYPRCDNDAVCPLRHFANDNHHEPKPKLPYGPSFKDEESVNTFLAGADLPPFIEIKNIDELCQMLRYSQFSWKFQLCSQHTCYQCGRLATSLSKTDGPFVCRACKSFNLLKWDQWGSIKIDDDNSKVALVTGGRSKIGFQTALRLLKSGYTVIVTTRFPHNALSSYQKETDSEIWLHRLQIYGIDFRHLPSVNKFIQFVQEKYSRLDILINNAAQTIRRPTAYYKTIYDEENRLKSLPYHRTSIESSTTGSPIISSKEQVNQLSLVTIDKSLSHKASHGDACMDSADMSQIEVSAQDRAKYDESIFPKDMVDEHGEQLDMRTSTTWNQSMEEISMEEMLEVQLINVTVPFMLMSQLSPLMVRQSSKGTKQYSYIINVTSQEGSFTKDYERGYHIHTNMAKASLNMMTSSTAEQYIKKGIFVCSVDPGWVTKMTPNNTFRRLSAAPLFERDGATRILDPIYTHMMCKQQPNIKHGILYKHYKPSFW